MPEFRLCRLQRLGAIVTYHVNASKGYAYVAFDTLTHLKRLEAEAIFIMREVAAEFKNPVMLYSIGKDSSVMLHLAMKAFHPSKPPFPAAAH